MNPRTVFPRFMMVSALLLVAMPRVLFGGPVYLQTNLTSDGSVPANNVDPALKNPWGLAFSSTSPFWVSDQATGAASVLTATGTALGLQPAVPGGSTPPQGPTGQVFNSAGAGTFAIPSSTGTVSSTFLFDTLGGTIDGWNSGSTGGSASALVAATEPGAVFTGLAEDSVGPNSYLYAANSTGGIDVYDTSFANVTGTTFAGKFVDPNLPVGVAPFNIQNIGGNLYVTYASLTAAGAPLPGGFVDEYDSSGDFIKRVASNGPLEAPWGLALAPATGFGAYSGDLLVGNFGNGEINAFDPATGAYLGTLDGSGGTPLVNDFLWALDFGNGSNGANPDTLYFTAGVNDQMGGLFGAIQVVPEPGMWPLLAAGLIAVFAASRLRRLPS